MFDVANVYIGHFKCILNLWLSYNLPKVKTCWKRDLTWRPATLVIFSIRFFMALLGFTLPVMINGISVFGL